jgi:hypothetical protein
MGILWLSNMVLVVAVKRRPQSLHLKRMIPLSDFPSLMILEEPQCLQFFKSYELMNPASSISSKEG